MQVADHLNAEVVAGTIGSKQDAIDYLTWTFFYRRVLQNPSYYDLEDTEMESVSVFLSDMIERNMALLQVWRSPLSEERETGSMLCFCYSCVTFLQASMCWRWGSHAHACQLLRRAPVPRMSPAQVQCWAFPY